MNNEFKKMQRLAGLIKENQAEKMLNEGNFDTANNVMAVINQLLEINEGGGNLKIEKQKDGKYYWTFTFKSGKVEEWPNGFASSADAQKDFMYRSKPLTEGTYNQDIDM